MNKYNSCTILKITVWPIHFKNKILPLNFQKMNIILKHLPLLHPHQTEQPLHNFHQFHLLKISNYVVQNYFLLFGECFLKLFIFADTKYMKKIRPCYFWSFFNRSFMAKNLAQSFRNHSVSKGCNIQRLKYMSRQLKILIPSYTW